MGRSADGGYTGPTVVTSGTLQVGTGGAAGTLSSAAITDNGALVFNRSDTLSVANWITGTGSVTNAGGAANILNLSGAQDYATLNASSGATNLIGSFTSGTAAVNAASGARLYFIADQMRGMARRTGTLR